MRGLEAAEEAVVVEAAEGVVVAGEPGEGPRVGAPKREAGREEAEVLAEVDAGVVEAALGVVVVVVEAARPAPQRGGVAAAVLRGALRPAAPKEGEGPEEGAEVVGVVREGEAGLLPTELAAGAAADAGLPHEWQNRAPAFNSVLHPPQLDIFF